MTQFTTKLPQVLRAPLRAVMSVPRKVWSAATGGKVGTSLLIATTVVIGAGAAWWFLKSFGESCHADPSGWWTNQVCKDSARSLWTAVSGIAAGPALLLTWFWRTTHRKEELRTALESQVTGRFVAAVELLSREGPGKGSAQEGGIYALERIAIDSPRDLETVTNILAGFVRSGRKGSGAHPPDTVATAKSVLQRTGARNVARGGKLLKNARLQYADLSGADLSGATLEGAVLPSAIMHRTRLKRASLMDANLSEVLSTDGNWDGADLSRVDLRGAHLHYVKLNGAILRGAHLEGATLLSVDLKGADLTGAGLKGANLTDVDFQDANLSGSDVSGVDFVNADVRGANLSYANLRGAILNNLKLTCANGARVENLTQKQADSAYGDLHTVLPEGIERPSSWK